MPSYRVWICDRCSKRLEAEIYKPGWCEILVMHGSDDDLDEDGYILCDECSPVALDWLRSWVADAGSGQH